MLRLLRQASYRWQLPRLKSSLFSRFTQNALSEEQLSYHPGSVQPSGWNSAAKRLTTIVTLLSCRFGMLLARSNSRHFSSYIEGAHGSSSSMTSPIANLLQTSRRPDWLSLTIGQPQALLTCLSETSLISKPAGSENRRRKISGKLFGIKFLEISAKTGANVEETFVTVANEIISRGIVERRRKKADLLIIGIMSFILVKGMMPLLMIQPLWALSEEICLLTQELIMKILANFSSDSSIIGRLEEAYHSIEQKTVSGIEQQ